MASVDEIQSNLTQKLKEYELSHRISFDVSAMAELDSVSSGTWEIAKHYAGTAVLNALQNEKGIITAEDIKEINGIESVQLMLGGKDIWDNVRYIGLKVPNIVPEGVKLRRVLSLWDADRDRDSGKAASEGRLPQYALASKIQYESGGTFGPEVIIPFRYTPSKEEVLAVAVSLKNYVDKNTGEIQKVEDITTEGMGSFGAEFFVRPDSEDILLSRPNYRIKIGFGPRIEGVQGIVTITRESYCKHDEGTLENYVDSVRSQ